jgi:signal peptidase I
LARPGGITGGPAGEQPAQTGETEHVTRQGLSGSDGQPPESSEKDKEERGGLLSFFRELPGLILVAFVLALLIKTFLVQAFFIPSASMVPTLQIEDRVLVNKLVYDFGVPQRFDIIVFEDPNAVEQDRGFFEGIWDWLTEGLGFATAQEQDFIKRVIGLPGDQVEIKEGEVFINGELIEDPPTVQTDQSTFGPITVEEDKVFVMGDNRANSSDSRSLLGQIPYDKIVGKAFVLLWPPSRVEWLSDD